MDRLICKRGVSCMWDHHRLAHIHSPYLSDELDLHFIWVGGCMLLCRTMTHPKKTKILDLHGPSLASRLILHDFYTTTTYTSPFFRVHLIFYKHMLCYLFFPIYTNHSADTILTYHSCNLARKYTPYLPKASAHMFLYRINNNNIRKI